ncbi:uncharacterized protein LOC120942946 [Rana temporaria]|uniref:uncharacterized protein LOC120942946 n=1 Tax=Rana temporaria TaxID=8407 RepID=UPI001AACF8D3|nr:uncharacterized protein LOC120942946 [Rana temporaria]
MRGGMSLSFLLVLLCSSNGWTRTEGYHCKQREGTSLTILMDETPAYHSLSYSLEKVLNSVSARFPCVTRQYTTITLDRTETNETITNDKSDFLQCITRKSWDYAYYYKHMSICNQSLLYGLKRALEISPSESLILVYTFGCMADYNDTRLLSEVYTLLEEKKSQVYFLRYSWYCKMEASQKDVFNEIASLSYGGFIDMRMTDNYELWRSFELLLSKPLNSTLHLLNICLKVTEEYTKVFSVPTSLSYLLITRNQRVILKFTDPNGSTFAIDNTYYYNYYNYYVQSSNLIKTPAEGSWILNARGNSSLSLQILGFTGNYLDSDCHPNATCSEFGGYGECTCKKGFSGDGTTCNDIDECQDDYTNNCDYYSGGSCVNTIGSYTCNCSRGYKYISEFGCVDIDECADSSLNDCDPIAICRNHYYGSYTCTCPDGYYGDGRHCEVNECQQGTLCDSNEDCMKYIGSYSCVDPCSNHTVLDDSWRSTSNKANSSNYQYDWYHCDYDLSGWYRFKREYDQQIPEHCIPVDSCGADFPIWMNGSHPTVSDGIVNRTACSSWYVGCCTIPNNISVKKCPEGFYVYKLQSTPTCYSVYCTESNHSCSGLDCAPGEECGIVDGVHGCYCRDSSNTTDGMQLGNVEGKLKKCPREEKEEK